MSAIYFVNPAFRLTTDEELESFREEYRDMVIRESGEISGLGTAMAVFLCSKEKTRKDLRGKDKIAFETMEKNIRKREERLSHNREFLHAINEERRNRRLHRESTKEVNHV